MQSQNFQYCAKMFLFWISTKAGQKYKEMRRTHIICSNNLVVGCTF
jgi:hypothetical protein